MVMSFSRFKTKLTQFCSRLTVSRFRISLSFLLAVLVFGIYMMLIVFTDRYYRDEMWYEKTCPCNTPERTINEMKELAFTVSSILKDLDVSHALCYGTLWGALRIEKILPWDNNIDFCVLSSEISKPGWSKVQKKFQDHNLDIRYSYRDGEYTVVSGSAELVLNMFYVSLDGAVLHDGWRHRFLWFFQDEPMSFPKRLLEPQLPVLKFHGKVMPVPHEGLEIQKYLYRNDWWLEKVPPGC